MKKCTSCDTLKDLSEFGKDGYKKSGYTSHCKKCIKKTTTARRAKDPAKARAITKSYRIRNRDKELARYNRYNKEKPEVRAAHAAKRRAYNKSATPAWLTEQQKQDMKVMYALAKKFEKLCNVEYHVDHIVPLAGKDVCGLHVPWNLQLMTASMNFSKGNNYNGQETLRNTS